MSVNEAKDMVAFRSIQRSYPPGEEMTVHYLIEADSNLKTSTRDWVGLFRVGWTSSRDYYTFEWAPEPESGASEGEVKFAGRRLPPEDGHFYQLCYVSRDGTVRGASAPFQFAPLSVSLEDMELVEVNDDSMNSVMVLQRKSKEMESLRRESDEARTELGTVQRSFAVAQEEKQALASGNAELRQQLGSAREELGAMQGEVMALKTEMEGVKEETGMVKGELEEERRKTGEKDVRILDLEHQLAAKCESEQKIMEQLERERGHNQELLAVKEGEEQQLEVLKKRISEIEGEVVELTSECEDFKQQIRIKDSQVDDLQRLTSARGYELEQVAAKLEAYEQQNAELNAACAELRASLEQCREEMSQLQQQQQNSIRADIDAVLEEKDERIEQLEQDLACTQANITEIMGAQQNPPVVVEQPQHGPRLPQNVVDKGAYIALQQAYETFEKYYRDEKSARERVILQLKTIQEVNVRLQAEYDTMVQRVQVCKDEYESKAQECTELQRRLKKEGLPTEVQPKVVGGSEQKIREMEREQGEMIQNCQAASEQLSVRQRECDQQRDRIVQLEAEVTGLTRRYEEMVNRHDKKIAEKNEALQRRKLVFDEKAAELATAIETRDKLADKVAHLVDKIQKIQQHKGVGEDSSRNCPVCTMKFPLRMTQQEYERHVQAHFGQQAV